MLSITISCLFFVVLSSFIGFPISGTHTIVGSLIGAGIAGAGLEYIGFKKLFEILISWLLSPLVSAGIAGLFILVVTRLVTNDRKNSFEQRLFVSSLFSGLTLFMIILLTFNLIFDEFFLSTKEGVITLVSAFIIGYLFSRYIAIAFIKNIYLLSADQMVLSLVLFWDFKSIKEMLRESEDGDLKKKFIIEN